jgi:hypothetical protein
MNMPRDETWADTCIEKVQKSHPTMNESVTTQIRELLTGQQSERLLRGSELTNAAKALIAAMATLPAPKEVKDHED